MRGEQFAGAEHGAPSVSLVVPVYDEADGIEAFHDRAMRANFGHQIAIPAGIDTASGDAWW